MFDNNCKWRGNGKLTDRKLNVVNNFNIFLKQQKFQFLRYENSPSLYVKATKKVCKTDWRYLYLLQRIQWNSQEAEFRVHISSNFPSTNEICTVSSRRYFWVITLFFSLKLKHLFRSSTWNLLTIITTCDTTWTIESSSAAELTARYAQVLLSPSNHREGQRSAVKLFSQVFFCS